MPRVGKAGHKAVFYYITAVASNVMSGSRDLSGGVDVLYTVSFYICFAIFSAGLLYRLVSWIFLKANSQLQTPGAGLRLTALVLAAVKTIFSPLRVALLLKAFVLDVLLQVRIFRASPLRWIGHMMIFYGFMTLLLVHALEGQISERFFSDYYSTVNPYMFLRNLCGAAVLAAVAIGLYRRRTNTTMKQTNRFSDRIALVLLAVIMISGFLLEATKIISEPVFDRMVADYSGVEEEEELEALKVYWAANFSVVFEDMEAPFDEELLEQGEELHQENCMDCHVRPGWAFVSYPLAKAAAPAGNFFNRQQADTWFWYIHVFTCLIGMAYLPFSKFLHVFSSTVSLTLNGLKDRLPVNGDKAKALSISRRKLDFDACTHCGVCSIHCSVAPLADRFANQAILPSEKLAALKRIARRKNVTLQEWLEVSEGSHICSSCNRCTELCPAGLNLQQMWLETKKELAEKGYPSPGMMVRENGRKMVAELKTDEKPLQTASRATRVDDPGDRDRAAHSFHACFTCRTCTNSCPVVANCDNVEKELDMMPHQIMHLLAFGQKELAMNSRMIWDCTTCYTCQENCPQGVPLTDIFYELKNEAYREFKSRPLGMTG